MMQSPAAAGTRRTVLSICPWERSTKRSGSATCDLCEPGRQQKPPAETSSSLSYISCLSPILPWQMIGGINQKTAAQKRFRTAVAVGVLKLETDSDESVQELAVAVVEEAVTAAGFVVVIAVEPAPGAGARARVHADVVATHAATAQPAQSTACTA